MARPRRRKSIASKVGETVADPASLYEAILPREYGVPPSDDNNAARVTVSVHPGLLRFIDDYVEWHPETNRSAIFDQALELWVRWTQAENDKRVAARKKTKQEEAWSEITTEAAKFIWP